MEHDKNMQGEGLNEKESNSEKRKETVFLHHDDIKTFIEDQLRTWPLAKSNYNALASVDRRALKINGYDFHIQYNPARKISTGAKIDKESIQQRKCFLCKENRPKEQFVYEILPGWEMLVNPYPILPVHLTIVSKEHKPQKEVPHEIVELACKLPGMAVFFNGAKAGASAPDHLHLQAVLKEELPLLRLVEKIHPESLPVVLPSDALLPGYPFFFFTGVVEPDDSGLKALVAGLRIGGSESGERLDDPGLVNTFFWVGEEGKLRFIAVPRRAHRPECYSTEDGIGRMISPGCIDMTGLVITPRHEDFQNLTEEELLKIYNDVAFPSKK